MGLTVEIKAAQTGPNNIFIEMLIVLDARSIDMLDILSSFINLICHRNLSVVLFPRWRKSAGLHCNKIIFNDVFCTRQMCSFV